jgi:TolB-like protein
MSIDVFISYRRTDEPWARRLYNLLSERGVAAWYDAQVAAGEDWRAATAKALEAAPVFVLLYSKAASESDDITKELAAATFSKKQVIPVRLENIPPSGPFLYELASRNWIDAYDDTEAKLANLADRIAAQVKAAPVAVTDAAAAPSRAPEPPAPRDRRHGRRVPAPLLAALAGAVLLAAAIWGGMTLLRPAPPAEPPSQRVAFFGFTAEGDDPEVLSLAKAATDETFATFANARLETAAQAETASAAEAQRLARAAELGALYALSGSIRPDGDRITVSMLIEDVPSRATLWKSSVSRPVADPAVRAPAVAQRTASAMRCLVRLRSRLTNDNPELVRLVANLCRDGASAESLVTDARALTQAQPMSSFFQGGHAYRLAASLERVAPAARAARLAETKAAIALSETLDPQGPYLAISKYFVAGMEDAPLADREALLLPAVSSSQPIEEVSFADANMRYALFLGRVGRLKESETFFRSALANDPLGTSGYLANLLAPSGRTASAQAEFEKSFARNPDPGTWRVWFFNTAFFGAGDPDYLFSIAPSAISPAEAACWRDIEKLWKLIDRAAAEGAARARECVAQGAMIAIPAMGIHAAFGDLDSAFALLRQYGKTRVDTSNPLAQTFTPPTRPMRADARFLPLMKELGVWDYWLETGTQPDVCLTEEERNFPVCVELGAELLKRQAQGAQPAGNEGK